MIWKLPQNRWPTLPETALRRWQAERLRHYLRTVVLPFSTHYGELFRGLGLDADSIRTLDDLHRLPFTTKADLLNSPEHPERVKDFLVIPDPHLLARRPAAIARALLRGRERVKQDFESEFRPIFVTFTTGRSAEPTPFFYTQRDLGHLATAGGRIIEICGGNPNARLLNTFPFAPHLAFWLTHYAGTTGGVMMLSSGGGKVMGTEGNLRLIKTLKPDVLIGMPTFIYHLLHEAAETGLHCENLKLIVLSGEKVSDGLRVKLRDLAKELDAPGIDVLAIYGFTEAKMAWPECPFPHGQPSSGYHLYPDLGIIEIIEPKTCEILPPGQPGEIVFTPLDARGTVVLRYRTGDYIDGGLIYEPCPYCGRSVPRLVGNISRGSEIKEMNLEKLKGTLVDFNELEHVLDEAPQIGAWLVELRKVNDDPLELDELVLHVQKVSGADESELKRDLSERCFSRIELRPNRIFFHNGPDMRQLQGVGTLLKERKLVDSRPMAIVHPAPVPATLTASLPGEGAVSPDTTITK